MKFLIFLNLLFIVKIIFAHFVYLPTMYVCIHFICDMHVFKMFLYECNKFNSIQDKQLLECTQNSNQCLTFDPLRGGTSGAAPPKTIGV